MRLSLDSEEVSLEAPDSMDLWPFIYYQYEVAACNGNAPLETGCYHGELFLKLLMNKLVVDCF